jgi:hypothetical protein
MNLPPPGTRARTATPQTLIDEWRAHRERLKPPECDHRAGCWVIDPYGACTGATAAPGCTACGGKIGYDERTQHHFDLRHRLRRRRLTNPLPDG